jgi:hypothetical protein
MADIKRKTHLWKEIIAGTFKCRRCKMFKYKSPGKKTIYTRGNNIDNSATKNNCFILSNK